MHSPEMVTVWTNLSALAFFSDFACRAASAPRVAARKSAIARDSVIACPLLGQPFSHREATGGVSQTPSAGLNHPSWLRAESGAVERGGWAQFSTPEAPGLRARPGRGEWGLIGQDGGAF